MIKELCNDENTGTTSMERWQSKIRRVRQYLRGWAKNTSGKYKKEKKAILNMLDTLDKKAEHTLLLPSELDTKRYLNNRLAELLKEEEIKWYQRAKTKDLLQGDANTKYFQFIANGKHKKTRIKLQDGDRNISGDDQLKSYITTLQGTFWAM